MVAELDWRGILAMMAGKTDVFSPSLDDLTSALRIDEPFSLALVGRNHIRVDVFHDLFPRGMKAAINGARAAMRPRAASSSSCVNRTRCA